MSRTRAHAPYWTYAVWWEPSHHLYCPVRVNRYWQKRDRTEPCNLPEQPMRHAGVRTRSYVGLCTWEPIWPSYREAGWLVWKRHTPAWFIKYTWSGPNRVRERDQLGKMAREYNATGGIEDGDFPNWQARHCARWLWD